LSIDTTIYPELARRGLGTVEDLHHHNIWIPDDNQWNSLKARLIDFIDPLYTRSDSFKNASLEAFDRVLQ